MEQRPPQRVRWAVRSAATALIALAAAAGAPPAAVGVAQSMPAAQRASTIVISAVFADGYARDDDDEAVQIWNLQARPIELAGYRLVDGSGAAAFPLGARIDPGAHWWLTRDAVAFARSFGLPPDWAWGSAAIDGWPSGAGGGPGEVGRLVVRGAAPRFSNTGETIRLLDADRRAVDAVRYGVAGEGDADGVDWHGPPVVPYRLGGIGAGGQVLYRKLDPLLERPVTDTDAAVDWASDAADGTLGRRVRFPGWSLESRLAPVRAQVRPVRADDDGPRLADGAMELAVAPDALLPFLVRHLDAARTSIDVAAYTFDNADLADLLADKAAAGVRVRVMVDGAPVGGHSPAQRWCLNRIATAGGRVAFMGQAGDIRPRYRSFHAKLIVIDDRVLLIGTENPGLGAAPAPGHPGHRGAFVATALPEAVEWAVDLLAEDLDGQRHADVRPYQASDPSRGAPAADYFPPRPRDVPGVYAPIAPDPAILTDVTGVALFSSPENMLHPSAGLLALLDRSGRGDVVRAAQLREPWRWGDDGAPGDDMGGAASEPTSEPMSEPTNPRVAAYLGAARRGARVRILLDGRFDDGGEDSNRAMAARLNAFGRSEHLDLEARLADPAGGGLHAKVVLVSLSAGRDAAAPTALHWVHLGSWNGTEVSAKANREAAIQFESGQGYAYLGRVFDADWATSPAMRIALPWLGRW
ncbi:MAG: phospholipase D-like domain-containing protein [Ardenticatenales bacterium]